MPEDSDPPRKFYDLKPREFEVVNALPRQPGERPPASAVAGARPEAIDVNDLIRSANSAGAGLAPKAVPAAGNDVHAILRDNLARANAAGLNELAPKPRRASRRKRHYWALMLIVNAGLLTLTLASGPKYPFTFVYGIAGLVIFNLGLWWVMWQIMEDY